MTTDEKVKTVACKICGISAFSSCRSGQYAKLSCRALGRCFIREKSPQQLDYVLSPSSDKVFLNACPGSGKTEVVGLKASFEISSWSDHHRGVAVLTFTNNAADEIRRRVQLYSHFSQGLYPHFVGTIDSWLHGYVAHPFSHEITGYKGALQWNYNDKSIRLVDEGVSDGWINAYKLPTPYVSSDGQQIPLFANMIRFDVESHCWEMKLPGNRGQYIRDQEYFDSHGFAAYRKGKPWLTLDTLRDGFKKSKRAFLHDGFATYQDIEVLSYQLIKHTPNVAGRLSSRFPLIIVDECQDLSWIQLQIFGSLLKEGVVIHLVGDLNQSIYEFKRVDPIKVSEFVKNNGFQSQLLSENFRSCQAIVDVSSRLVHNTAMKGRKCSQTEGSCLCYFYEKEMITSLPGLFEDYLRSPKVAVSPDKAAILARGWSTVDRLHSVKQQKSDSPQMRLAYAIQSWGNGKKEEYERALLQMGKFISSKYFKDIPCNPRRYYCPKTLNSVMEWRMFLGRVLSACVANNCNIGNLGQSWTEWAAVVRNEFGRLVSQCSGGLDFSATAERTSTWELDGNMFKVPHGLQSELVSDTIKSAIAAQCAVQITTIHDVKGRTFEAVMLVSSPDRRGGKGGYWEEWIEDSQSEHARFAYVASSRPQRLLVWAIPQNGNMNKDRQQLSALGLQMTELQDIP